MFFFLFHFKKISSFFWQIYIPYAPGCIYPLVWKFNCCWMASIVLACINIWVGPVNVLTVHTTAVNQTPYGRVFQWSKGSCRSRRSKSHKSQWEKREYQELLIRRYILCLACAFRLSTIWLFTGNELWRILENLLSTLNANHGKHLTSSYMQHGQLKMQIHWSLAMARPLLLIFTYVNFLKANSIFYIVCMCLELSFISIRKIFAIDINAWFQTNIHTNGTHGFVSHLS